MRVETHPLLFIFSRIAKFTYTYMRKNLKNVIKGE